MTRDEVVAVARQWLGTTYRPKGRSEQGLDCLGLLVMLGRAFQIPHTDEQDYSLWPRADRLILTKLDAVLVRLAPMEPRPGDIGVFAAGRLPGHVGVFSERHGVLHMIHARVVPPRVIEEPWAAIPRTELRLIGLYALPGLED